MALAKLADRTRSRSVVDEQSAEIYTAGNLNAVAPKAVPFNRVLSCRERSIQQRADKPALKIINGEIDIRLQSRHRNRDYRFRSKWIRVVGRNQRFTFV